MDDYELMRLHFDKMRERSIEIETRIKTTIGSLVHPGSALGRELEHKYTDVPEALLLWADRLLYCRHDDEAKRFIALALENADRDKKPGIVYGNASKILRKYRFFAEADEIQSKEASIFVDNPIIVTREANTLIVAGKPLEAVSLLERLHAAKRGDLSSISTLGAAYLRANDPDSAVRVLEDADRAGYSDIQILNQLAAAYIQSEQTPKAVELLEDLHSRGKGNNFTIATLASAYVIAKDAEKFEKIKDKIEPQDYRDYLQATLFYLTGRKDEAQKLLLPQIYSSDNVHASALFMACLGEDHPLYATIRGGLDPEKFDELMERRDKWIEGVAYKDLAIYHLYAPKSNQHSRYNHDPK